MSQKYAELLEQMKISTRLIAEEAIKRGFGIDYFRGGKSITGLLLVHTPDGAIALKSTVGTLTKGYGVFVANNKLMMGRLFQKFALPTPDFLFYQGDDAEATAFLERHQRVVVKPIDTDHGTGVSTGITNQHDLKAAIGRAASVTKKGVLIQQMCEGIDHRLLVVGDKLIAAAYREPASVVGDGEHTVGELVATENQNPLRGKGHSKPMTLFDTAAINAYLLSKGKSFEQVPAAGESVQLLGVANLSQGGRAVDITDRVHPKIAAMAVRAAQIAGLGVCGVDIMCTDISKDPKESKPYIIELNESPGIRMHHFPAEGKSRDVAGAILDQALTFGTRIQPWES